MRNPDDVMVEVVRDASANTSLHKDLMRMAERLLEEDHSGQDYRGNLGLAYGGALIVETELRLKGTGDYWKEWAK